MKITELKNKKVLILGFGREGTDTFLFLRKLFPKKVFGIADKNKNVKCQMSNVKRVRWYLGKNYLKAVKDYKIIIKTPGIPPKILKPFLKKEQKVTSQTEIFLENCPGKVIGVTGTKGKSTTCSLIYKILKEGNLKVHLVGNIGKPVLNLLFSATPRDIYIYELSSHQLFGLKKSPQIAVLLNIFPEHLDYYKNFKEYLMAKANITLHQSKKDYLIYNFQDREVKEIAKKSNARKIALKNYSQILKNFGIKKTPFLGNFYLLNVAAAVEVGKIFGVKKGKIKRAIENFKPLPHRLEYVGTFKGVKFYNDSLATIPESTISAIDALEKDLQTIILGGFERGQDFKKLVKKILKSKIQTIILFPTTGRRIWKEIQNFAKYRVLKDKKYFFVENMKEAVKLAYRHTKSSKTCLLSPASASFNLFKNYAQRGNLFKKYVKILGKNEKKKI